MGAGRLNELQQAWDREYGEVRAYTTSYRGDMDRGVHFLLQYLAARGERIDGPIVDCGCGMGRNAIPLARSGHQVLGLLHERNWLSPLHEANLLSSLGILQPNQAERREPCSPAASPAMPIPWSAAW